MVCAGGAENLVGGGKRGGLRVEGRRVLGCGRWSLGWVGGSQGLLRAGPSPWDHSGHTDLVNSFSHRSEPRGLGRAPPWVRSGGSKEAWVLRLGVKARALGTGRQERGGLTAPHPTPGCPFSAAEGSQVSETAPWPPAVEGSTPLPRPASGELGPRPWSALPAGGLFFLPHFPPPFSVFRGLWMGHSHPSYFCLGFCLADTSC